VARSARDPNRSARDPNRRSTKESIVRALESLGNTFTREIRGLRTAFIREVAALRGQAEAQQSVLEKIHAAWT